MARLLAALEKPGASTDERLHVTCILIAGMFKEMAEARADIHDIKGRTLSTEELAALKLEMSDRAFWSSLGQRIAMWSKGVLATVAFFAGVWMIVELWDRVIARFFRP